MTHRLILIRHAKSDWTDPFADDHARVLNKRGRASAKAIGDWMQAKDYAPDIVLCSDATRTRETADIMKTAWQGRAKIRYYPDLYLAAPSVIQSAIIRQDSLCVAVIGHNPGLGMLASALVATPPEHERFRDYPTCATTVVDFDIAHWRDMTAQAGHCADFMVPRDLIGTTGEINK